MRIKAKTALALATPLMHERSRRQHEDDSEGDDQRITARRWCVQETSELDCLDARRELTSSE